MVYIGCCRCSYLVFDCWQSAVQSLPQTQTSITLPLSLRFLCLHHLFKQVSLTSQNIGKAHRQHPVVSTAVSFSVCQCIFYNYKRLVSGKSLDANFLCICFFKILYFWIPPVFAASSAWWLGYYLFYKWNHRYDVFIGYFILGTSNTKIMDTIPRKCMNWYQWALGFNLM